MSVHPEILWAQRSSATADDKNIVYLTVNLTEINESTLKLDIQPKKIIFEAKAGRPDGREYKFELDLYAEINPEETKKRLNTRSLELVLRKKETKEEFWPRLTTTKLPYVKTDFDKWVDEDEQEGAAGLDEDFDDTGMGGMGGMPGMGGMGGMPGMGGMGGMPGMGGMGGMPGMGGMGGMPGMGGLGGMGGGGMDFQKMMEDFKKKNDEGMGPEGIDAADSDSDDGDDGPPPLEDAEPSASGSSS